MFINLEQDVSLALIAAICGLAFPIIIQTIGQIDTKYGSTRLIERIKRSWQFYFFILSLIVAIALRIYYCFAPQRIWDFGQFNSVVDNSALLLVYFVLIILIVSLFFFTFLVIKYYSPTKLLNDISKRMIINSNKDKTEAKKKKDKDDTGNPKRVATNESIVESDFNDWTELVISVLLLPNYETMLNTLNTACDSLYHYVYEHNKDCAYCESVYPNYFYNSLLSINKAVCIQTPQFNSSRSLNIVTNILIDNSQQTIISADSYNYLWLSLSEQLYHNRTDLIIDYWTAAYQHYSFRMNTLIVGKNENGHIITKQDFEKRESCKKQFKIFNCSLGALLLYNKYYTLLVECFNYKNSISVSVFKQVPFLS